MVTVILPKGLARLHLGQTTLTLPVNNVASFRSAFAEQYPDLYAQVFPKGELHPHFAVYVNGLPTEWQPELSLKAQDQIEFLLGVSGG